MHSKPSILSQWFLSHFYIAAFELIALFWFDLRKFKCIAAMLVNNFFKHPNSFRALTTREKEIALWREKARTTADSDWPSDAPIHPNLRQRAQARGMRRSLGRVARRAAGQICRWREKDGMIKFSKRLDFFRRFAQRAPALDRVGAKMTMTEKYFTPRTTKSSSFWARFLARFPPKPIEKASKNVRRTDRSSWSIEAFYGRSRESAVCVYLFLTKSSGTRPCKRKNDNGRKIVHTHVLFLPSTSLPHPFTSLYHYWFLLSSYIEREGEKFSIALRSGYQLAIRGIQHRWLG